MRDTKLPENCVDGLLPTTWSDGVVRELYGKVVHSNGHCFLDTIGCIVCLPSRVAWTRAMVVKLCTK